MLEKNSKKFKNGSVYCIDTGSGLIETTDTFLPYQTINCIYDKEKIGSRLERWMIGVSTMSGCPVGCKFCATGKIKSWRNLTDDEIYGQVKFITQKNCEINPIDSMEFKINYTRMGEPFFNINNVKRAIDRINNNICYKTHHYISTIGIKDSDFSFIKGNSTLQISLHSTDEKRRKELIPIKGLMSIKELGMIRTNSNKKTTINMTLIDNKDFDINVIKENFDPRYFFIKLSPVNKNEISSNNGINKGVIYGKDY